MFTWLVILDSLELWRKVFLLNVVSRVVVRIEVTVTVAKFSGSAVPCAP